MLSTKPNIQKLLSLMLAHNVCDIVICPGSRNMPLAQSFANIKEFHCHPITDERSAGFVAIGLSVAYNKPVAVCVTSGSALLNLASAVSEAFYQQVPILVISADRPFAWIGQLDGQTLPQANVFGSLVRKTVSLPEPIDETEAWLCNRLINEALLELNHHVKGPVHINIPITEPFFDCSATTLPNERVIRRNQPYIEKWGKTKKPIILIGQTNFAEAQIVKELINKLHCPVFCETLSNIIYNDTIDEFDIILNYFSQDKETIKELQPDLVVYVGGHIVSKRLKKWIRQVKPEVWRVDPCGECSDTFQNMTNIIELQVVDFLKTLHCCEDHFLYKQTWTSYNEKARKALNNISLPFSSLLIIQQISKQHSHFQNIVLANSSTVRHAQLFVNGQISENLFQSKIFCNRGVNGIDGSLSAAIGIALAHPDELTLLIIGDLSFFYDMNALWNTYLPNNLRIALLNNNGGEIFRNLPGLKATDEAIEFVFAKHDTSAKGWVESVGASYCVSNDKESAKQCITQLYTEQKCTVAEFFINDETEAYNLIYRNENLFLSNRNNQ